MKTISLSLIFLFALASCSSEKIFPVSPKTPAAKITVKQKKDKNNNYHISVSAKNLASPDRLEPARKVYVIWITTKNNGIKNIGQLNNENAENSGLETVTAFEPKEIFITAEEAGNVSYPSNFEISRISL